MFKKIISQSTKVFLVSCLLVAGMGASHHSYAQQSDAKAMEIIKKVDHNARGYKQYAADMTMTLIMKNGKSFNREIKTYNIEQPNDYERSISVFKNPADVKGTKLLVHAHEKTNDDQWIFLPALKKPKRIANENKSGAFMGSEVAFEDLGNAKIMKFEHKFVREDKLRGRDCYVIHSIPLSKYSGYSYLEVWVDKQTHTGIEDRFYDKKKELLKISSVEFKLFNNRTYLPVKLTVKNAKNGNTTIIKWEKYDFNSKIDNSVFAPEKFDKFNG